ncbi:MAG: hypothetical protein HZA84_07695 [Thaumarchaeota archaeon]|nr:hypothetical protein [Nitrososphaerota archaeon]
MINFGTMVLLGLSLLFVLSVPYVYAISSSTDKTSYGIDDKITVSGNVGNVVAGKYIGLQIRSSSDLMQIDQFMPSGDGSFSKEYFAKGAKWNLPGTYSVIVAYDGQTATSTFQFSPEPNQESPEVQNPTVQPTPQTKPKIPGFPALDTSPQHYFERYQNDPVFKEWFEEIFHGYTIQQIVGYKKTHLDSFPDMTKSRQYYLDRYNNEKEYKTWFDSQFPGESIYEFFDIAQEKIPDWIKNSAKQWSGEEISDSDFANGIKYLIENNFIKVSEIPDTESESEIPNWVRNNASWWASGKITEDEFINAIKYLIENKIIILD